MKKQRGFRKIEIQRPNERCKIKVIDEDISGKELLSIRGLQEKFNLPYIL